MRVRSGNKKNQGGFLCFLVDFRYFDVSSVMCVQRERRELGVIIGGGMHRMCRRLLAVLVTGRSRSSEGCMRRSA